MIRNDFVAVYNAASNTDAHLVKLMLEEAGVEAHVAEDHAITGLWFFGTLPEIYKPQVWVKADCAERARELIIAYEAQAASREQAEAGGPDLEVVCEDCGRSATYPAAQRGTVQVCPHCGAYVDVEDGSENDPFWQETGEDER